MRACKRLFNQVKRRRDLSGKSKVILADLRSKAAPGSGSASHQSATPVPPTKSPVLDKDTDETDGKDLETMIAQTTGESRHGLWLDDP